MQIAVKSQPSSRVRAAWVVSPAAFVLAGTVLLAGCASPGPPLPPSLKLPAIVTDLRAERIGAEVSLHWTVPTRTTDGVAVKGPMTAAICREISTLPLTSGANAGFAACAEVARLVLPAGAASAVDKLPPELSSVGPSLLAYRVRLFNAAGKTAGSFGACFRGGGCGAFRRGGPARFFFEGRSGAGMDAGGSSLRHLRGNHG